MPDVVGADVYALASTGAAVAVYRRAGTDTGGRFLSATRIYRQDMTEL
jgi:hypothetical protein